MEAKREETLGTKLYNSRSMIKLNIWYHQYRKSRDLYFKTQFSFVGAELDLVLSMFKSFVFLFVSYLYQTQNKRKQYKRRRVMSTILKLIGAVFSILSLALKCGNEYIPLKFIGLKTKCTITLYIDSISRSLTQYSLSSICYLRFYYGLLSTDVNKILTWC